MNFKTVGTTLSLVERRVLQDWERRFADTLRTSISKEIQFVRRVERAAQTVLNCPSRPHCKGLKRCLSGSYFGHEK